MNTDNQTLLLVDDRDNFSGEYAKRVDCHIGKGLHHRAFVVLVENNNGKILMQKRKHKLWNNFWDTTAISHPLHLKDRDESYVEAANRALKDEMGIESVKLVNVGGFNYFAQFGAKCENEYCAILVGEYNGPVNASKDLVYEYKWIPKKDFIDECIKENPSYTPWAILTGKFLKKGQSL